MYCPYFWMWQYWREYEDYDDNYRDDDLELEYEEDELVRQITQEVNRIMRLVDTEFANVYAELRRYGMSRNITRLLFRAIVNYVVRNAKNYTGNINQKTDALFISLRRDMPWIFATFIGFRVPARRTNEIIRDLIKFTLENIK